MRCAVPTIADGAIAQASLLHKPTEGLTEAHFHSGRPIWFANMRASSTPHIGDEYMGFMSAEEVDAQ
jgi:hypothetical protein